MNEMRTGTRKTGCRPTRILTVLALLGCLVPAGSRAVSAAGVELSVLPSFPFVRPGETVELPLRLTNRGSAALEIEIVSGDFSRAVTVNPGEEESYWARVPVLVPGRESPLTAEARLGGRVAASKQFLFLPSRASLRGRGISVQGPYLKDGEGRYLFIVTGEVKADSVFPDSPAGLEKITVVGDVPAGFPGRLASVLRASGSPATVSTLSPEPARGDLAILEYYLALAARARESRRETVFLFPSLESLRRMTPVRAWAESLRAQVAVLAGQGAEVIIFSPFPSAPEPGFYRPYRSAASSVAAETGAAFMDLFELYLGREKWADLFLLSPGVYAELPVGEDGLAPLVDRLFSGWEPTGRE